MRNVEIWNKAQELLNCHYFYIPRFLRSDLIDQELNAEFVWRLIHVPAKAIHDNRRLAHFCHLSVVTYIFFFLWFRRLFQFYNILLVLFFHFHSLRFLNLYFLSHRRFLFLGGNQRSHLRSDIRVGVLLHFIEDGSKGGRELNEFGEDHQVRTDRLSDVRVFRLKLRH